MESVLYKRMFNQPTRMNPQLPGDTLDRKRFEG
jgi:hypothetical protein